MTCFNDQIKRGNKYKKATLKLNWVKFEYFWSVKFSNDITSK